MESYCGKDCGSCAWSERLNCPGCEEGMGKRFSGPCGIAACCREKGHRRCDTCGHLSGCPLQAERDEVPAREFRRREEERVRRETLTEQAPVLGKWLWLLFWLVAPREVGGVFLGLLSQFFPRLDAVGTVLSCVCFLACAFFFWRLGPVRREYQTASLCQLALSALCLLTWILPGEHPALTVLNLGALALGFCRNYLAYRAHALVLAGVDDALSERWRRLWKYTVWVMYGLAASILLLLLLIFIGFPLAVVCCLALLVLEVLEMVYLWRTAKAFRTWQPRWGTEPRHSPGGPKGPPGFFGPGGLPLLTRGGFCPRIDRIPYERQGNG